MKTLPYVAVVAVLLMSGCATPQIDSPVGPGNPTVTSTSVAPEQERETGLVPPAQVFGGDCEALFTSAEISDLLGMPVTARSAVEIFGGGFPYVEQHGGIRCQWAHDEFAGSVYVIALPADAVDEPETMACDVATESGQTGCSLEVARGGIRISGAVFRADNDSAAMSIAQAALIELFEQRASGVNVAPLPLPAVGSWAWPVDCAAVVAEGDFSAVPGLGATASGGQTGGSDGYYPRADFALWGEFQPPYCDVHNGDVYVNFNALGGGRWAEATVNSLAGATALPFDGVESVVVTPADGLIRVDAFDGPNWVNFYVRYESNAGVLAQALIAALDTTAIE